MERYTHLELMEDLKTEDYDVVYWQLRKHYRRFVIKIIVAYLKSEAKSVDIFFEDIEQVVWLAIHTKLQNYLNDSSAAPFTALPTFIETITRNACVSYFIRSKDNRYTELDENCPNDIDKNSVSFSKEMENQERIEKASSGLSDEDKKLLRLYTLGYTFEEISQRLQINFSTAKVKILRLKQKLRKNLLDIEG